MRKFLVFTMGALIVICSIYIAGLIDMVNHYTSTVSVYEPRDNYDYLALSLAEARDLGAYEVYVNQLYAMSFDDYDEALAYAALYENAAVMDADSRLWLWDNHPGYNVYHDGGYHEFYTFLEALDYAKAQAGHTYILYRKDKKVIWSNDYERAASIKIEAPLIRQMPDLPRGCEVTSLAMLLNAREIAVDKMTLAAGIEKDMSAKTYVGGVLYGPDPNKGFIGDMYNMSNYGLGVYHRPIYALLQEYAPQSAVDLTGCDFDDLFYLLNQGAPVWIITNSTYQSLPSGNFERWMTENGEVQITYRMHSVLVTGYSEDKIFFNDPYGAASSANKANFIAAWEQMGRQAVAITPDM